MCLYCFSLFVVQYLITLMVTSQNLANSVNRMDHKIAKSDGSLFAHASIVVMAYALNFSTT